MTTATKGGSEVKQAAPIDEIETTFRVGRRYRCSIRFALPIGRRGEVGVLQVEWDRVPPRPLSRAEMRDYRRGRDALLAEAARMTGESVMIADMTPAGVRTTIIRPATEATEEGTHDA